MCGKSYYCWGRHRPCRLQLGKLRNVRYRIARAFERYWETVDEARALERYWEGGEAIE